MTAPVRRQILVPLSSAESFEIFTRDIGRWWPMGEHSVDGAGGTVSFTGRALVETTSTGNSSVWGEVLEWIPGRLLRMTWHPGGTPERATEVRVTFDEIDRAAGGVDTLVTLEHDGWERLADPQGRRDEYNGGWVGVIARYGRATVPDPWPGPDERTWIVLRHNAGAAAPATGPIFAHPDFAEHVAFLSRLETAGVLVAAGPLAVGGQPGAQGMTVIRVPSSEVEQYLEEARSADLSVARGLLEVQPMIWNVRAI